MLQTCLPGLWGLQNEGASWLVLRDINCRSHETDCADHTGLFHGDDSQIWQSWVYDIKWLVSMIDQLSSVKKTQLKVPPVPLYSQFMNKYEIQVDRLSFEFLNKH